MTIPNFLIGGPPKCASTSLYFYLKQHPEIFMSPVKQTRFFSENYNKGTEFYVNTYFSGIRGEKMAGEATPGYFLFPFVVERIHNFNPGMKFIFCLRNPVERAFSGWNMRINNGTEKLSFQDALRENLKQRETVKFITEPQTKEWEETRDHHKVDHTGYRVYIEGSLYAFNLKYYYNYFDPSQVKIIFLDSLKKDFDATMRSIFSFLGVDENYIVQNTEQQNTSKTGKVKSLGPMLRKVKKISRAFSGLLPKSFKKKMFDTMFMKSSAEGSKAKLTIEDRKFGYEIFKEDIAELEKLLKTDLGHWKYAETNISKNILQS
jgi:hypothetical protein